MGKNTKPMLTVLVDADKLQQFRDYAIAKNISMGKIVNQLLDRLMAGELEIEGLDKPLEKPVELPFDLEQRILATLDKTGLRQEVERLSTVVAGLYIEKPLEQQWTKEDEDQWTPERIAAYHAAWASIADDDDDFEPKMLALGFLIRPYNPNEIGRPPYNPKYEPPRPQRTGEEEKADAEFFHKFLTGQLDPSDLEEIPEDDDTEEPIETEVDYIDVMAVTP